jgi:hypothetical protein
MIDNAKYAFRYNKTNPDDVLLGHGLINNGVPHVLPMLLDARGRWNGVVP